MNITKLKVGDKVRVITKPPEHKYQYKIGRVFNILELGVRCVYSSRYECIDTKHLILVHPKNVIGGELC